MVLIRLRKTVPEDAGPRKIDLRHSRQGLDGTALVQHHQQHTALRGISTHDPLLVGVLGPGTIVELDWAERRKVVWPVALVAIDVH